jgi:hypothetical protein
MDRRIVLSLLLILSLLIAVALNHLINTTNLAYQVTSNSTNTTKVQSIFAQQNKITANSCNSYDVQNAIKQAQNNWTVIIPDGTCTWMSHVLVNKSVNIEGQSRSKVVIIDEFSNGWLFTVTPSTINYTAIGNLTFKVGSANFNTNNGTPGYIVVYDNPGEKETIIHNLNINTNGTLEGMRIETQSVLIYNNTFNYTVFANYQAAEGIQIKMDGQNMQNTWEMPSTLGTKATNWTSKVYIEHNTWKDWFSGIDMDDNSRVVVRGNFFDNSSFGSHGAETSPNGVREYEIYNNTFTYATNGGCNSSVILNVNLDIFLRGGSGVIFDNVFPDLESCAWGQKTNIVLADYNINRLGYIPCQTTYPSCREVGQGWNPNAPTTHTECANTSTSDYGTGYYTEGLWVWGNTGTGNQTPGLDQYTPDQCGNGELIGTFLQEGRDYFVGNAMPGYTAQIYPDPMRLPGGGGSTTTATTTVSTTSKSTTSTTSKSTTSTTSTGTSTISTSTESTTTATTTSTMLTNSTTTIGGGGGGTGGGGTGGGSGSSKPVIAQTNNGFVVSGIAQKNVIDVSACGENMNIIENFITPTYSGVSINNQEYTIEENVSSMISGTSCYVTLLNTSYLPIQQTITLELYNSTEQSPAVLTNKLYKLIGTNTTTVNVSEANATFVLSSLPTIQPFVYSNLYVSAVNTSSYTNPPGYKSVEVVNASVFGNASANVLVKYSYKNYSNTVIPFRFSNGTWSKASSYSINVSSGKIEVFNQKGVGLLGLFVPLNQTTSTVTTLTTSTLKTTFTTTMMALTITKQNVVNYWYVIFTGILAAVGLSIAITIYKAWKKSTGKPPKGKDAKYIFPPPQEIQPPPTSP